MKVVITGITGQDGSTMADYLLKHTQATIYGIVRQLSVSNHNNIGLLKLNPRVNIIEGDITCPHSMGNIIRLIKPDYFINFAANSFVRTSWETPAQVFETNTLSVMHQLEAIRQFSPKTRYYQAGSSEEFGDVIYSPQDEKHPLRPRSPYGASKAAARHLVKVYRDTYGLYAVAGWLFNHEGIRRGKQFVTRKITTNVARIFKAIEESVLIYSANDAKGVTHTARKPEFEPMKLGNMSAKRDWSDAEDFIDGVWKMLNQPECNPNFEKVQDYVLASGETHTVADFVQEAFNTVGIKVYLLNGSTVGYDHSLDMFCIKISDSNYLPVVYVDKDLYRPAEVDILLGDSSRARKELGWKPRNDFRMLVQKMVQNDLVNNQ